MSECVLKTLACRGLRVGPSKILTKPRVLVRIHTKKFTPISTKTYNPGDQLQKCRSPIPTKVPKKCFGKCRPQTGCRGKCRKSAPAFEPLYRQYRRSTFSALSLAPRLGPALSEALFGTFVGRGFGTSVAGRQDCNPKLQKTNSWESLFCPQLLFLQVR